MTASDIQKMPIDWQAKNLLLKSIEVNEQKEKILDDMIKAFQSLSYTKRQ